MTLFEFVQMIEDDELTDEAVKKKWDKLCDALKDHGADHIREMIKDGALSGLLDIEGDDGFGTEGMDL